MEKIDNIKYCSCKHEYQDKMYGPGKRVHTPINKPTAHGNKHWRCTVCGAEKP